MALWPKYNSTGDIFQFSRDVHYRSLSSPRILNLEPEISAYELQFLDENPSKMEIFNIVKYFQPLKAPRPDGLHPIFYQKCWSILGKSVENLCEQVFRDKKIPENINDTHIFLIPKNPKASSLKQFRPISFCNTSYKIISKILELDLL